MPPLLALALVLDQRIELQLGAMLLLALGVHLRKLGTWDGPRALWVLATAAAYLVLNTLAMMVDPTGVADNWWAASLRVWLFYVLFLSMARCMGERFDTESVMRTVEWLFGLKLLLVVAEGAWLLSTGEPRERALFNIVLDGDTLFGVRFTSSYDFLFALFALASRRRLWRLLLLGAAILTSETRALLLLSGALFACKLMLSHDARTLLLRASAMAAAATLVMATIIFTSEQSERDSSRLLQVAGSSLDDKLEQVEAVGERILSPYLVTGRGLGATLSGIERDELRPYSYEAQTIVMLWQGGLLFFVVHWAVLWRYLPSARVAAAAILLGLGCLNPTLFGLASAFFLLAFGRAWHDGTPTPPR